MSGAEHAGASEGGGDALDGGADFRWGCIQHQKLLGEDAANRIIDSVTRVALASVVVKLSTNVSNV
jgi:hypothetical protein